KRPDLKFNTALRSDVQLFKEKSGLNKPEVLCDICDDIKIKALKMCLKYICQKHEKPLELFCRDDQICVCLVCTATNHRTHNIVVVEEESGEKK
ncbi:hypothetical protein M9458_030148, partial [Cirrhinus mrigala]